MSAILSKCRTNNYATLSRSLHVLDILLFSARFIGQKGHWGPTVERRARHKIQKTSISRCFFSPSSFSCFQSYLDPHKNPAPMPTKEPESQKMSSEIRNSVVTAGKSVHPAIGLVSQVNRTKNTSWRDQTHPRLIFYCVGKTLSLISFSSIG